MSKTKAFIKRAREVHGDRYDYTLSSYTRAKDKLIIICDLHGLFRQTPDTHVSGGGCKQCGDAIRAGRLSNRAGEEFIEKASLVHGNRYDYSKVKYTRAIDKIVVTCRHHGNFEPTPNNHLSGSGCPECALEDASARFSESYRKSFAVRAQEKHGDKYDYSKVSYINSRTKVLIICGTHGEFSQEPRHHVDGSGCPRCPYDFDKPANLYLLSSGSMVKIGVSMDVSRRLKTLSGSQPFKAGLVSEWTLRDYPCALAVEKEVHNILSDYRAGLTGFDGATEWFNVTPDDAASVINGVLSKVL